MHLARLPDPLQVVENVHALAVGMSGEELAGGPGTPAATEALDVLDGIIVTLARDARKSARSAAKQLGKPALTADFELTKLYPQRKAKAAVETGGGAPGGGAEGAGRP